jgi:hypothetical protein
MNGEQFFVLVIVVFVVIMVALMQVSKNRYQIKRSLFKLLNINPKAWKRGSLKPEQPISNIKPKDLSTEEDSKAEFKRLQKIIEDRKQNARETDISYHLWGLYNSQFRNSRPQSSDRYIQDGEWYAVKTLRKSTENGLNKFEFELRGSRYTFVDDEENQGWCENIKYFSLFLYDDSDRCLIEIPMKIKADRWGRRYSISSDGPNAFLPGDWVKEFINVKLKYQHIRNKNIRSQKHQERLSEIEDLKERFGISD